MAYNKDTDYQAKINEAVKQGDYASASRYEKERNEKIEKENLSYEKTNNYNMPYGVDDTTYNKMNTSYSQSETSKNKDRVSNQAFSHLGNLTNKDQIISNDVMSVINSQFVVPEAVKEADAWLSSQLEKIQSGKTSYSDQVKDMMDKIMNRERFSYDVDNDQLFQQALASAMNSGKQAMQDTIGQASALTGGYGSTYATTAGNQAYNAFIEDAYDNLPQYYQMAMEAYQMEGDEMYRQFGMLSDLDDKEFNRNLSAYDATYSHRNTMYNEAYTQHRDKINDAFAMANLQLNEHGQLVNDAFNYYNAAASEADKLYEREYSQWADSINQAMQMMQMQNSDAWANKNFDESVRQYEDNQKFQAEEAQKQRDWQSAEAEKERAFTASENAKSRAVKSSSDGSGIKLGSDGYYASDKQKEEALDIYIEKGGQALESYLLSQKGGMNYQELVDYVESQSGVPVGTTITKTENTMNGFLGLGGLTGHIDSNDKYTITYPDGTKKENITASDLPELIRARVDNLKQGKSITW